MMPRCRTVVGLLTFAAMPRLRIATRASATLSPPPPPPMPPSRRSSSAPLPAAPELPSASVARNVVRVVGVVHDIQQGFLIDDPVTQLTLTVTQLNCDADGGPDHAGNNLGAPFSGSPDGSSLVTVDTGTHSRVREKDHVTVRCVGTPLSADVRHDISEGAAVVVNGQLKINRQVDSSAGGRIFPFPYVSVRRDRGGWVRVLHGRATASSAAATGVSANAGAAATGAAKAK